MNEQILIGLFTIGGTLVGGVIGGLFSVRAAKIGYNKETMLSDIKKLSNQVQSYWYLEKEYLDQLTTNCKEKQRKDIQITNRKNVEKQGYEYPKMTASQAMDIIQKYE